MTLYIKYLKVHFKKELEYRTSFCLSFLAQFFVFFGYYFTILCLFDQFSNIKGFTLWQVLLTFGIIQFGFSFCETFFRGIDQFDHLIVTGNFDRLLLRPRNILGQVCCEEVSFIKFARLIQSLVVLGIAIWKVEVIWNFKKVITLVFMLLSSICIFLSILILSAAYCFLTVKGLEVRNVLTDGSKHLAQYPIGIFKRGFVIFFTYILPLGFVNYYPLLFLLDRSTNPWLIISPLITIFYLFPSIALFYLGIRKYSSSGS